VDGLFVLYLASVAFGYGWISDTKFQKFSDKHWIRIFKKFSDMDQESKNQYPLTSGGQPKILGLAIKFDIRRATVFLFGTPLLKAQND